MNKYQKNMNSLFSQTILKKLGETIEKMKYYQAFEILKSHNKKSDNIRGRTSLRVNKPLVTLDIPRQYHDGSRIPEAEYKRKLNEVPPNGVLIKGENDIFEKNPMIKSNAIAMDADNVVNNVKIPRDLGEFQTNDHKIYSYRENYDDVRNQMKFENENKPRKLKNKMLKIGDVIYFKYIMDAKKDSKSQVEASILSGDGIANNKLECILKNSCTPKNASFLFKKCLFRVETSRKYNNRKLLQNFLKNNAKFSDTLKYKQELEHLKEKIIEENEENVHDYQTSVGNLITYGQNIHLRHIYSGCYLTVNPNKLSKQYGCIEISLEENGSEYSIFKFVSSCNLKKKEDAVCYSDSVLISSVNEASYHVHVWDEINTRNNFENGLEINASDIPSTWKILHYLSYEEISNNQNNNMFVEPGDIIQVCHKKTGAILTVSTKELTPLITPKIIYLKNDSEDNYGSQRRFIEIDMIDTTKTPPFQTLLQNQSKISFYSLWELQRKCTFDGGFARYIEAYRLKNVSTGLYLAQDLMNTEQLILNPNGNCEECFFYFKPKKINSNENRLEYDDLLRIQAINADFFQSMDENLKEKKVLCGSKIADQAKMSFFLRQIDLGISEMANRISSLYPYLMSFYSFLQKWGIITQYNVKKKEYMTYDYQKALESERDLELEVDQLMESIENLEDFLLGEDKSLDLKAKQQILLEQKIIEILLMMAKLIDSKLYIHMNDNDDQEYDNNGKFNQKLHNTMKKPRKLHKIHDIQMQKEWILLEKTPQYIARKYLHKPLRYIYNILLLSIKDNPKASKSIFKAQDFLSTQLIYYRNEVGILLKEMIKNATNIYDKDINDDDIVEWIYLLEMIKTSEGNTPLQILYLEIISLGCVDYFRNTGIQWYQNRITNEMLSKNSKGFLKNILTFKLQKLNPKDDEPKLFVIFNRDDDASIEDFLDMNRCLDNNMIRSITTNEIIMFNVEDISKQQQNNEVDLVSDYIVAIIMLYYSLCKGRNSDSINKIIDFFPHDLIFNCIKNDNFHVKIRRAFIFLYQVLYIDIQPFVAISKSQNRCYVWTDSEEINMNESTYKWLNLTPCKKYSKADYNDIRIQELNKFIENFWLNGFNSISKSFISPKNADLKFYEKSNIEKMKMIHSMLELSKIAIDYCWTDEKLNNQILYSIIHIFIRFPNNNEMLKLDRTYWLSKFILGLPIEQLRNLNEIYVTALDIFLILTNLRQNILLLNLINIFKYLRISNIAIDKRTWNLFFTRLFQIYGLNILPDQKLARMKSIQELKFDNKLLRNNNNNNNNNTNDEILIEECSKYVTGEDIIHGGIILLNVLFEVSGNKNKTLEKQIMNIFKSYFSQRKYLKELALNTEIIVGSKEFEILCELDSSMKNHVLSPDILEKQINKVLLDDEQEKKQMDMKNQQKLENNMNIQIINDIRNSLDNMVIKFKSRKSNYKLYYKTQNLLRNLKIHTQLVRLFKLNYKEKNHYDLFTSIVNFLCHFCKRNIKNQNELYPYVNELLSLVDKKIKPAKLIYLIFNEVKRSQKCSDFIDHVFNILYTKELRSINDIEYVVILRTLLLDNKKLSINENQRKIMSKVMKNHHLLASIDYKYQDKKEGVNNIEFNNDLSQLQIHTEIILLLAGITLECGIGIQQAKKILSFDYIKSILSNSNTPFIQKKPLLRCLYQIYITKYQELNKDFDKYTMIDIFNTIIIPDLQIFHKYIEGIVSINTKNVEKRRRAKDLRFELSEFKNKLANIESKQDKLFQQQMSRTQVKELTQKNKSSLNIIDNKRLVYDVSEYWDYLTSGKSWDLRQDGLLYFVLDCFYEIESRKWLIDDNLQEVLSNTRYALSRIADVLLKIEDQYKPNLSRFKVLINECIDNFPNKKLVKVGKNFLIQGDNKDVRIVHQIDREEEEDFRNNNDILGKGQDNIINKIFRRIKTYIMKKKITIEDFHELIMTYDGEIKVEDFKSNIKMLMGNMITKEELEDFVIELNKKLNKTRNNNNIKAYSDVITIDCNRFFNKLRKYYDRERQLNRKDVLKKLENNNNKENINNVHNNDSIDSLFISSKFQEIIEKYTENCLSEYLNIEIEDLSSRIHHIITNLFKDKNMLYIDYISKLISSFTTDADKLYLLKILKSLIEKFYDYNEYELDENEAKERSANFKRIQHIYNKAGVNAICIDFIKEDIHYDLLYEATCLLILTLKRGNRDAQSTILELLKKNNKSQVFFNFIKSQLWKTLHAFKKHKISSSLTKDRIGAKDDEHSNANETHLNKDYTNEYDELEKELIISTNLIKIIQYFCENCYLEFQNFLREQIFDDNVKANIISSNIVYELSLFLINLQEIDQQLLHNKMILPLVQQCLETLTDTCMGPCQENQVILARQRHLISFINTVLEEDIKFTLDINKELVDVFAQMIKFVMALVAANRNEDILLALVKQLHIDRLIDKLIKIYKTKIGNRNLNIFRQEIKCMHKNKICSENYCVQNYLTIKDFIITETAFNIYILLTIFSEKFPNEEKVQTFKIQTINMPALRKYENQFGDKLPKYDTSLEKSLIINTHGNNDINNNAGEDILKIGLMNVMVNNKVPGTPTKDIAKRPLSPGKNADFKRILPFGSVGGGGSSSGLGNGSGVGGDGNNENLAQQKKDEIDTGVLFRLNEEISVNGDQPNEEKMSLKDGDGNNVRTISKEGEKTPNNKAINLEDILANPNQIDDEMNDAHAKDYQNYLEIKRNIHINQCINFFKGFVASVEINKDNILSKCYFQVPSECDYMTENIRNDMIFKANHNSDVERLEHFISHISLYRKELIHRQSISKTLILEFFVKNWRFFKDIAFVFVIANNLIMLIGYIVQGDPPNNQIVYKDDVYKDNSYATSEAINLFFSLVQMILSFIVFIFCIIERLPISTYKETGKITSLKKKNELKKNNAVEKNTTSLMTVLQDIAETYTQQFTIESLTNSNNGNGNGNESNAERIKSWLIYLRIFLDFENIYNLIYLIISIVAFIIHPLIYSILLLDIIKRSNDLKNVIRAVTLNWRQLIKTVFLGLIIIYLFAIIAFIWFRDTFQNDIECSQLLTCWTSIIIHGLRDGGGIGNFVKNFVESNSRYWGLYFYILAFWILIIILLLNFIFGIIIDTFGELRDLNKEANIEIRKKCFICGKDRYEFDTKGQGWYEHVYIEHNIYNYLNYMIYLQKKNINECNGIEKYVKERLDKTETSFFPIDKALILEEIEGDNME